MVASRSFYALFARPFAADLTSGSVISSDFMMSMKLDRVLIIEALSLSLRLEEISLALSSRMAQASSFVWLDFYGLDAGGGCDGVLHGILLEMLKFVFAFTLAPTA